MLPTYLAKWMSRLGTENAFVVLAKARELEAKGKEVIHLQIGEPDFDTPSNIIAAAKKALDDGFTHYGPSAGLPILREAICKEMKKTRNLDVKPDQVVIAPGGKPIMFYTMMTLIDPGDEVIIPNPGYPIYESVANYVGAKVIPLPLLEEKDFRFDPDVITKLVNEKTKLIVVNSPQNPTGGILTKEDLKVIADLAIKYDCWILADEIYSHMVYEGKFETITQFNGLPERTILLDGFSKTYAMTGWRMGYGVMPKELASYMTQLQTNVVSHTASFIQIAGVEALSERTDNAVNKMVDEFKKRREVIVAGLNRIPKIHCCMPHGAFYVFPNISAYGIDEQTFADRLLNEGGVAGLSGTSFGQYGKGFIRLSYANSIENINKALNKIEDFVKKI
ncbi:MAG: pyridoxal phosphate-dependent aminotransferase [Candidatus Coatesbacteria bacterium]|nr:pyridoxal phosphate-dependent aminotransferase [Candidatus Coatesbacteria bacterium]